MDIYKAKEVMEDNMARPKKVVDASIYAGRFTVKIKTFREQKKLTIKDVAEQSGIPASTIYNWEQGISPASIESLPLLAEVFRTTVPKLMPRNYHMVLLDVFRKS